MREGLRPREAAWRGVPKGWQEGLQEIPSGKKAKAGRPSLRPGPVAPPPPPMEQPTSPTDSRRPDGWLASNGTRTAALSVWHADQSTACLRHAGCDGPPGDAVMVHGTGTGNQRRNGPPW